MPICDNSTCGSLGTYSAMLVENSDTTDPCDPATFDVNSERYEILYESLQYTDVLLGGRGINGTLDKIGIHTRHGARIVTGQVVMEVGPVELDAWLPRILGNDEDPTDTFATDITFDVKPFDIMLKRDLGTVIYRHCGVRSAMFSSRASIAGEEQVVRMVLDIVGYEEHDATYPASPPPLPSSPRLYWLIGDSQLLLDTPGDDQEYYFDAFNLRINNKLVVKPRNFLRATCMQAAGERQFELRVSTPYTADSHTNLYINSFTGQGQLKFLSSKSPETPAAYSTTFNFPELRSTRRTPNVRGRGEIPLSLDLEAYRTSADEPLTVTNVSA